MKVKKLRNGSNSQDIDEDRQDISFLLFRTGSGSKLTNHRQTIGSVQSARALCHRHDRLRRPTTSWTERVSITSLQLINNNSCVILSLLYYRLPPSGEAYEQYDERPVKGVKAAA